MKLIVIRKKFKKSINAFFRKNFCVIIYKLIKVVFYEYLQKFVNANSQEKLFPN